MQRLFSNLGHQAPGEITPMARKHTNKSRAKIYKGFLNLPNSMTSHPDFISLSGKAIKLLIDIARQYNGYNNGDLCCSMSLMKVRGWNSNDLLSRAIKELIEKNWIILTKCGGLHIGPSLYAITWQPIDECGGKLDVLPTTSPPRKLST